MFLQEKVGNIQIFLRHTNFIGSTPLDPSHQSLMQAQSCMSGYNLSVEVGILGDGSWRPLITCPFPFSRNPSY